MIRCVRHTSSAGRRNIDNRTFAGVVPDKTLCSHQAAIMRPPEPGFANQLAFRLVDHLGLEFELLDIALQIKAVPKTPQRELGA